MIDEIKTVSTVEELYKSNGAPTGEIIVDAVVDISIQGRGIPRGPRPTHMGTGLS